MLQGVRHHGRFFTALVCGFAAFAAARLIGLKAPIPTLSAGDAFYAVFLFLIAIMAVPSLRKAWNYDAKAPENVAYYGVPMEMKVEYGVFYLGLAAFLAIMTESVYGMLTPGH